MLKCNTHHALFNGWHPARWSPYLMPLELILFWTVWGQGGLRGTHDPPASASRLLESHLSVLPPTGLRCTPSLS